MNKSLIIYGASNPTVFKVLDAVNRHRQTWTLSGFLDDGPSGHSRGVFYGHNVLGDRSYLDTMDLDAYVFFNNIFGSMKARKAVNDFLLERGCRLTGLISPETDLHLVEMGEAVTIEQQVSIDAFTRIGSYSCLKRSCSVGHETDLGDYTFIGPGATICGRVRVGEGSYLGAGCVVRDGVTVEAGSIVGAGAVVVKDVPPGMTVVGNPAAPLTKL